MSRRGKWSVAVLLAVALGLTGCAGAAAPESKAAPPSGHPGEPAGRPIAVRLTADPGNLDPHTTNQAVAREVGFYLYDTLLAMGDDHRIVSGIASAWKQLSPTSYQFTVTPGVTCSDGTTLTASDVAANFTRIADPKTVAPFAGVYLGTNNVKAAADDSAGTLTLTLPSPNSEFLQGLATYPGIVCPAGLANPGKLSHEAHGTGPYTLTKAVPGNEYELTARPGYSWGPGGHTQWYTESPKSIMLKVVGSDTTAANLLTSGQLDVTALTGSNRQRAKAVATSSQAFSRSNMMLYFNQKHGSPVADAAVRRALAEAIDRTTLPKVVQEGYAKPAPSTILDSADCYDLAAGNTIAKYDPQAAAAALRGKNLHVNLLASGDGVSGESDTVQFLADAWRKAGVDVTVNTPSGTSVVQTLFSGGNWDVAILAQLGVSSPNLLLPYHSGDAPPAGTNFSSISNAEYDSLAKQALTGPAGTSCAHWRAAEEKLNNQVNEIPLYYDTAEYFGKNVSFEVGTETGTSLVPTGFLVSG
ncbi:ABC transporter substrate-binding protein [Amycolatopsis jejuensis]|uniref:ABC transporter substrate-binding protein n=1 Tax=Amycolatopsis jejuensis TaxID=330084 RepID=UPI00052602C5|nr:ABC transporter substrate-binding protein [Amycolatopsis jejuensis]